MSDVKCQNLVFLSGIQPSGKLHIGNYFGAIRQWTELQKENGCFIMVADLHALTVKYDPEKFQEQTEETVRDLLAFGIKPESCVLFRQSAISEHSELAWLLQTITPLGELERMTQFKEKSAAQATVNTGLFTYPVLQAADILLYDIDKVPVGRDQIQHIELTKIIARKFNNTFGETFQEPGGLLSEKGAKIQSLADPEKKMSKSQNEKSYLALSDPPETARKKIMSAVTDSGSEIKFDPENKPGIANLLNILSLLKNNSPQEMEKEFRSKSYAEFKKATADAMINFLSPFQKERKKFDKNKIRQILESGEKEAGKIARRKMNFVRKKMGLIT